MKKGKEKISIIVPCYNEESSLPIFYKEISKISKEMNEVTFEFLFINDGSKDKTLEILRELAKEKKIVELNIYHFLEILEKKLECMRDLKMQQEITLL